MAAPQPIPPPPGPGSGPSAAAAAFASAAPPGMTHSHPAAVAQYHRVALGIGLDGYVAPDLDEAYRLHAAHSGSAVAAPPPHATGQFGILAPTQVPVPIVETQQVEGVFGAAPLQPHHQHQHQLPQQEGQQVERSAGQLSSKIVVDPPDLDAWRDKLFNVDEMIVLTHEQFETYFPHVDNVYSHRSTQRYKRKPFVSHYWDCRMKGRPPGTPKSDDPNKKKRKRNARERDLCDVKIKITEYFPGAQLQLGPSETGQHPGGTLFNGVATLVGQRFWTVQRVNGNGGNGKGDGVAGPHKHTLEKSDEIKKNSVQRYLAKQERDTKKSQDTWVKKPPARRATGTALTTARKHAKENDLKLYAACFCPFSQRVWIALEAKGMAYQYCEADPLRRPTPAPLLEANPRGSVPAIRQGDWACAESGVILEYLEDLEQGTPLYPTDPRLKANCRLWIDHARINNRIIPAFYTLVQTHDPTVQRDASQRLQANIDSLVQAADEQGPFFLGSTLCLVDIHFAPFAIRLPRVLASLRRWSPPPPASRWARWLDAMEADERVRATTSGDELYAETADLLVRQDAFGG
ncbi:hypothetical protein FDECE_11693 [Fusarium decemcellulare]|nr:hypothetical protein FDECE_11693 [Fusarium decemcellulare]